MKAKLNINLFYICALLLIKLNTIAQISITNGSPSNTQNFDGMGTTTTLPTNWKFHQSSTPVYSSGTSTLGAQASSGSPTTGATYNWGAGASERVAGVMTSGSYASPNSLMAYYTNGGTSNITDLTISYDLERYRINSAVASITFFYSLNGSSWTAVTAGDIASGSLPTGTSAYNFSPSGSPSSTNCGIINKSGITISSLNISSSSAFYLRWNLNTTGSNSQGIGVDNVIVTATFAASCSSPSTQASSFSATSISSSGMTLNWLRGNGDAGVIVLAKSGSAVNSDPASGSSYTADATFMSGSQIGTGNYVVYQGTGTSVNVTGLNPNTTYHFAIYEYNSSGTCYNITELIGNATTLCSAPSIQASSIIENYSCANAITLNWTNGNGTKRVVIMNTLNSFTTPVNGSDPVTNSTYSGSGEQVIYNSNGNSVNVSGLNSSTTYWFRVYEYNCSGSNTVYLNSTGTNNPQSITSPTITCPTSNDYRTITSGNWGINTSWERGTGTGWANCADGDFPDVSTANVTIRNGHTIDNDGSGSPPWDVNNLTVESGGKLWDNAFNGGNSYIQLAGNIACNGIIGNINGDDIAFDLIGANTSITGAGIFSATRIRKDASINNTTNTNLIIDMDIRLTWSSVSGTVIYNDADNPSNFNVTINAGKYVRCSGPGSVASNVSIDGLNGKDINETGGTYNIYGTLDLDGILYCSNNNFTSSTSIQIKNGGLVKCRVLEASTSGLAGNSLVIENGGKLNIFGSVDTITASLNDTTWRNYSTTNNSYNFQSGSSIEYSGATRQLMNGITNYKNLIISGGSNKNIGSDINVDETLTLTNGIVNTGANKMIIQNNSSSSIVHNISNSISFINGNLRRNINSNTDTYQLPIGYSNSSTGYHPANFLNGNVTGVNYIDTYVNSIDETGNNVDINLNTMQQGEAVIDVINTSEWNIIPNTNPSSGNYGVDLFATNMNMSASDDNKFVVVKRADNSTTYADWNTFEETTFIATLGAAGRIYSSGTGFARRTNFTSFSKFAIGRLNNSVLPITVYDFKVNRISKSKNLIEWKSNDEENLLRYELEKSEDGFNYKTLNFAIPLEENNYDEKHYFVTDSTAIHAANYYKLFSIDNNGKRLYHDIAFINEYKNNEDFSIVYSNDGVTVLIDEEGDYTDALIYSSMGQLIKKFSADDLKTRSIPLNNSEFATGIYFIQVNGKNKCVSIKLIFGQ